MLIFGKLTNLNKEEAMKKIISVLVFVFMFGIFSYGQKAFLKVNYGASMKEFASVLSANEFKKGGEKKMKGKDIMTFTGKFLGYDVTGKAEFLNGRLCSTSVTIPAGKSEAQEVCDILSDEFSKQYGNSYNAINDIKAPYKSSTVDVSKAIPEGKAVLGGMVKSTSQYIYFKIKKNFSISLYYADPRKVETPDNKKRKEASRLL